MELLKISHRAPHKDAWVIISVAPNKVQKVISNLNSFLIEFPYGTENNQPQPTIKHRKETS